MSRKSEGTPLRRYLRTYASAAAVNAAPCRKSRGMRRHALLLGYAAPSSWYSAVSLDTCSALRPWPPSALSPSTPCSASCHLVWSGLDAMSARYAASASALRPGRRARMPARSSAAPVPSLILGAPASSTPSAPSRSPPSSSTPALYSTISLYSYASDAGTSPSVPSYADSTCAATSCARLAWCASANVIQWLRLLGLSASSCCRVSTKPGRSRIWICSSARSLRICTLSLSSLSALR
mmetsp:Transcript_26566/g.67631  ORF Transcript_26566/g.67631 Transcript_26566/m.67631 type:complete len:238 (+) Transcript_26566:1821-2534(+)